MNRPITLNSKQARKFANEIYKDIYDYVVNHKDEYEKFLLTEKLSDRQEINLR